MPPKRAKGRPGLDQFLDSAVQLAAYTNAADLGAAPPPVRTLSELQRDLEAVTSFMQEDKMSQLDGCYALETSPKALAALAQLLSSSLRTVTGASSAAASGLAVSANEVAGQRVMAGRAGVKATDAQHTQRAERTLSSVCLLLTAYFQAALDCAKCYEASVLPGAVDLVEVLERSDFLPAATQLLLAAREDPLQLNTHACDVIRLVNALANFTRRSDGLLSKFLTSFCNSRFLEVSIKAAAIWVIGDQTRGSVMLAMLHDMQEMLVEECSQPAAYSRVARVYSGPCLQYWTALQAVSQLHAADGGNLYGLPHAALLPPMWAKEEGRQQGQQRHGRSGGRQQRQRQLSCSGLINSINNWSWCLDQDHPVPLGALRPRALRSLSLRAARAALSSCGLHDPGLSGAVDEVQRRGSSGISQQAQQAAAGSEEGSGHGAVGSSGIDSSSSSGSTRHDGSGGAGGDNALGGRNKTSSGSGGGGSGKGIGAGGGASGRSGLPALGHAFEALDCSTLAIKAVALAVETMSTPWTCRVRSHAVVGGDIRSSSSSQEYETRTLDIRLRDARFASRWWPLVVRAVWAAMRQPHGLQVLDMLCCRPVLLMLQPWEMLMHHSDPNGVRLPASPPPGLSAACSAGLIFTSEAVVRHVVRASSFAAAAASTTPGLVAASASQPPTFFLPINIWLHVSKLLYVNGSMQLALLLAHGDPVQGAALLTTQAKAALRQAEATAKAGSAEGTCALVRAALETMYNLASTVRALVGGSAGPGASISMAAGFAFAIWDPAGMLAARSLAEQQLLRLWCFALPRWLPVLARMKDILWEAGRGDVVEREKLTGGITGFMQEAVRQAAVACRGAWHRGDVRAVASWRGLMQKDLCSYAWITEAMARAWLEEDWWAAPLPGEGQQQQQGSGGGGALGGLSVISLGWPFVLPLAPHEAASLLPTCSNPLCTALLGDTEADLRLGMGPGAEAGAADNHHSHRYCSTACRTAHRHLQVRNQGLAGT